MKPKLLIPFLSVALLVSMVGNMWQTMQRTVAERDAAAQATAAERKRSAYLHDQDRALVDMLNLQLGQANAELAQLRRSTGTVPEVHAPNEE